MLFWKLQYSWFMMLIYSTVLVSLLVLFSCIQLFETPWNAALQASLSFTISQSLLKLMSIEPMMPSSLPLSPPSPLALSLSQHQDLFQWVSSSHQVATVLELQCQHQSFQWLFRTDFLQDELVGSPCSPRDSENSSPTPQFKNIHSSAPSSLYGPTLTSVHDYWKNHSFDYTDFCPQWCLCFLIYCLIYIN